MEKAREFQESIYFCFIDCTKVFDCVSLAGCSPWGRRVRQDLGTEQQQTQFPLQRLSPKKARFWGAGVRTSPHKFGVGRRGTTTQFVTDKKSK